MHNKYAQEIALLFPAASIESDRKSLVFQKLNYIQFSSHM